MNIWTKKNKPLLVLAPMAGYTDSAFRLLCREFGADIVISELVSADAIYHGDFWVEKIGTKNIVKSKKKNSTCGLLSFDDRERPFVVQLFGKYPEKFAGAARWVTENLKPDGIDINMGCPARKVVGSDHGAALLKNPKLAVEIIKAVKSNTDLPVSVKTRLGWESDDEILEFAPIFASAGINAIIVHGRTYKDGFKGKARWENIYKVKEMLGDKVSVIGNGDITEISNIKNQISKIVDGNIIELDGIAIGRAAFGKPWIFQENSKRISLGWATEPRRKTKNLKLWWPFHGRTIGKDSTNSKSHITGVILRHAKLVFENKGEHGIIEFRKHLLAYFKGFPMAKELRVKAVSVKTPSDINEIVHQLKKK